MGTRLARCPLCKKRRRFTNLPSRFVPRSSGDGLDARTPLPMPESFRCDRCRAKKPGSEMEDS